MVQQMKTKATLARPTTPSTRQPLYQPLDSIMVRTPLLPIETYLSLQDGLDIGNPQVRNALAIGSSALLDELERSSSSSKDVRHRKAKLLRFLIRMSTRPTPYGLFAGVALAQWGEQTDLSLAAEPPRSRTRPDMGWLLAFVYALESRPDIRQQLCLHTNPTAFIHGNRVFMTQQTPLHLDKAGAIAAVSVRATNVVRKALTLARQSIPYAELAQQLLATTPGATPEKIEKLLTQLWEQTLLLTDLHPPLTSDHPARYVVQRLARIPAAQDEAQQLEALLEAMADYDRRMAAICATGNQQEQEKSETAFDGVAAYRQLVKQASAIHAAETETPLQVDMALLLHGRQVNQVIGREAARAAELLLRLTPIPSGPSYLAAYRQAFLERYGAQREVPLLELLDPQFGLGSLNQQKQGIAATGQSLHSRRAQTLLSLATNALHDRTPVIELDEQTLAALETYMPSIETAPHSLDLNVFVAAASQEKLDTGDFQIIVGPNLGAQAAGRNLGRFADLLGAEARAALAYAARAEEQHGPQALRAELVYLPHRLRSANVTIRPAIREYEIALGVNPGVEAEQVIPPDELVVGVRNNHFYVRWPRKEADILVCAEHMLNNMQAPDLCRFLSEVNRDGVPQLSPFDWGPAASFPFLPRVQVDKIVLRLAQWRIDTLTRDRYLPADSPLSFREALARWRADWHVPRHVYLSSGDNRLLLDLENTDQIEELRTDVRHLPESDSLTLQEALPTLDQAWLQGPAGHYMSEFVVSLALRKETHRAVGTRAEASSAPTNLRNGDVVSRGGAGLRPGSHTRPISMNPDSSTAALEQERMRPPGSEWLFLKLYCASTFGEDVIAYPSRAFAQEAQASGWAEAWFFVRYHDPDLHIRLRFRGEPEQLTEQLLPALCAQATKLMDEGYCSRFCLDTYEREIERYGGIVGMALSESLFAVDSSTVSEMLYLLQARTLQLDRVALAVLSIDQLLAHLGLDEAARLQWLRQYVTSRNEGEIGQAYRQHKVLLRSLLGKPQHLLNEPGGEPLMQAFERQREALAPIAARLRKLAEQGTLSVSLDALYSSYVHMHCNRLLGTERATERKALGLLLRTREGLARSGR